MTTLKLLLLASGSGVGSTTFLDSLPFPFVKVPTRFDCSDHQRYYALPTGDLLEVSTRYNCLGKTCDAYLVLWRSSVKGSREKARAIWERLPAGKKLLLENLDSTSRPSGDPGSVAFSFRNTSVTAKVLMTLIEKVHSR